MTAATTMHAELEQELRHVRDLVLIRDLLRARGAPPSELRECDAVIEEARARLSVTAKRAAVPYTAAA